MSTNDKRHHFTSLDLAQLSEVKGGEGGPSAGAIALGAAAGYAATKAGNWLFRPGLKNEIFERLPGAKLGGKLGGSVLH